MSFLLQHPVLLTLAAAAALASLLFRPPRGYYRPRRAAFIAALRALAATALVVLAGGLALRTAGRLNLVILTDRSESMAGIRDAAARVSLEARRVLGGRATLTVLDFADKAAPARAATAGAGSGSLDTSRTNLEAGLLAALPAFDPRDRNLLLLLSDGAETDGRAGRAIPLLRRSGIRVVAPDLPSPPGTEVELLAISGPDRVRPGQSFELKGLLGSTGKRVVTVFLARDGMALDAKSVSLDGSGRGEALFLLEAGRPGTYRYRMALEAGEGDLPGNNIRECEVNVEGIGRAVLVTEDGEASTWPARELRESSFGFDILDPTRVSAEGFTPEPDLVVLDDLPAVSLDAAAAGQLEALVRGRGTGLLVIGGQSSYGAGGYRDTLLEQLLPVTMGSPGRGPEKDIGLSIILDNSFSMWFRGPGQSVNKGTAPRKVEMARAAIVDILRILRPQDRIGILISNDTLQWLKRPGPLGGERDTLIAAIEREQPIGGGINFYSSLAETRQALRETPAGVRHIMIISDSNDIDQYEVLEQGRSHDLIRDMAREGITLSIFAIGRPSDKDIDFLKTAATLGKGDFYLVSEMAYLPRYFVSDAKRKKDELSRAETFLPLVKDVSSLMRGLSGAELPPLAGIDLVSAKTGAEEALVDPFGAPVLVSWKYGKGRVTAFTGDNGRRWAAGWPDSFAARMLLKQVISATSRRGESSGGLISAQVERSRGSIRFLLPEEGAGATGRGGPLAVRLEGTGARADLPLERTGWAEHRAPIPDLPPGLYRFTVAGKASPPDPKPPAGYLEMPAPAEYGTRLPGKAILEELVAGTGGWWLEKPEDLAKELPPPAPPPPDWWFWISLFAMAALFGEFLLRY